MKLVPHDDPILHRPTPEVEEVTPEVAQLASDMLEFMYEAKGIGLAAPQVGHELRMFVIDCSGGQTPMVCINPEVVTARGLVEMKEGCLSYPGKTASVNRNAEIHVRFTDANGQEKQGRMSGIWAICFQHELDHLDGVTMFDRAEYQAQAESTPLS